MTDYSDPPNLNDVVLFAQHTIDKSAGDVEALKEASERVDAALLKWPTALQLQDARGDLATLLGSDVA